MGNRRRDKEIYDRYEDGYEYDGGDDVDLGIPEQEDLYADYYPAEDEDDPDEGELPPVPEDRESYYARRDAYYARRDAYYAERDAYYARMEDDDGDGDYAPAPRRRRDPEGDRGPRRRARGRAGRRRRRKGWLLRRILTVVMAGVLVLLLTGKSPVRNPGNLPREAGHSTILLAGTDESGSRTDTVMLLSLERGTGQLRLLSIPRDTYTPDYSSYKINAAYGASGGGKAGMEELMWAVERTVGFAPDGYLLVNMDAFVKTVDLMGGLDFYVPVDMVYDDDTQDLHIDLRAGEQHLSGQQVMDMVRYRSGYANADIGRTEVQRDFIRAAVRQWIRFDNLGKLPELWRIYRENMLSDLGFRNILWVARVLIKAQGNEMAADVLPGWADMVSGFSVYRIDRDAAAGILAEYSPYA